MCKTQAEGGKRCYAHTRPRYEALIEAMDAKASKTPFGADSARKQARSNYSVATDEGTENALNVVANHASTTNGAKQVKVDIDRFQSERDLQTVAFLRSGLNLGLQRAEAAQEATALIKKAQAKIRGHRGGGAGTGSVEKLKPSRGVNAENNCLAVYPEIGKYWRAEDNNGIGPEQCTKGSNGQLNFRCAECQELVSRHNHRVNAMTKVLDEGRVPVCDRCDPRRKARFNATQQELTSLVEALGDDPEAFTALSPALQYSLMQKMGLLRGGEDSMSRSIGMSIVHGDLTLADVVRAQGLADVDGRVRENLDDEDALATIADIDITTSEATSTAAKVEQVLASTGVLSLIDEESDLARNIAREANESLWERAYANPAELDEYVAYLNSCRGGSVQGDAAIDRFTRELDIVRATEAPEGYRVERTDKYGNPVIMEPTLAQRRFAAMVEDRRRVMNWSGTGAGKTLSASLAVQATGARETLVVCPKAVIEQWQTEFKEGFPDNTEVRFGLPQPGSPLDPPPPGVNRVWIANYDKFQGEDAARDRELNALADRVDAIVYDEIHMAKASESAAMSQRHARLIKFTDRAGRANEDLVVIGASATPVVNDLSEAASVLRLVEGPESKKFPTKPTIKNAAAAHHRLASAGIRHMPDYKTTLTRTDETVDITANVHKVRARINALREEAKRKGKSDKVHPAMMERALLPEKLPKIVAAATKHKNSGMGPTVVYTEYTEGMVSPMRKELEAAGLRVGTYTGDESAAERTASLRKFRNGEIDVLIGSKPIATGVDGLQHTSHKMVVASMAWTAAQDDQLVGRLQRRGQANNVDVTYILTEAKVGDLRWSWCKDNRQKRVRFKRDIANAAVDGVLPDGALDSNQHGAEKALDALKDLTSALAKTSTLAA